MPPAQRTGISSVMPMVGGHLALERQTPTCRRRCRRQAWRPDDARSEATPPGRHRAGRVSAAPAARRQSRRPPSRRAKRQCRAPRRGRAAPMSARSRRRARCRCRRCAITASASSRASASCRSRQFAMTVPPDLPTKRASIASAGIDQRRRCGAAASDPDARLAHVQFGKADGRGDRAVDVAQSLAGAAQDASAPRHRRRRAKRPRPAVTAAIASTRSPRCVTASSGATASVPRGKASPASTHCGSDASEHRRIGPGIGDRGRLDRKAVAQARSRRGGTLRRHDVVARA